MFIMDNPGGSSKAGRRALFHLFKSLIGNPPWWKMEVKTTPIKDLIENRKMFFSMEGPS